MAVGFLVGSSVRLDSDRRRVMGCERRRRVRDVPCAVLGDQAVELSNVEWGEPKGEGSYGSVFFGFCGRQGCKIVVKCPKDVPLAKNLIETEKYVNKKLSVMDGRWAEYLGSYPVPMGVDIPAGTLRTCLVWKMEGDGSSLEDFLMKKPKENLSQAVRVYEDSSSRLNYATCKAVMRELLIAVAEMHDKGIMHRDVKPANIIVSPGDKYPLKIIDFGSACDWSTPLKRGLSTATCDPIYAAPEQRINILAPNKFDVFSLGLIAMQILLPSLKETWQLKDFRYRLEQYNHDLVGWCGGILENGGYSDMVEEVKELYDDEAMLPVLAQMLRRNPLQRASAQGVLLSGVFGEVVFAD